MPKITTLKFSPSEYKTKAEAVLDLLRRGLSVKEIRNRMAVSESYIYLAKKKLLEVADEAAAKAAKTTVLSVDKTVYPDFINMMSQAKTEGVDTILDERAGNYGSFEDVAETAQSIKDILYGTTGLTKIRSDQREALDMISSKIARIVNGDPNHIDSWIDIAGYATLVADRLQGKAR